MQLLFLPHRCCWRLALVVPMLRSVQNEPKLGKKQSYERKKKLVEMKQIQKSHNRKETQNYHTANCFRACSPRLAKKFTINSNKVASQMQL